MAEFRRDGSRILGRNRLAQLTEQRIKDTYVKRCGPAFVPALVPAIDAESQAILDRWAACTCAPTNEFGEVCRAPTDPCSCSPSDTVPNSAKARAEIRKAKRKRFR